MIVGIGRGYDTDVHPAGLVYFSVINFWKNQLIFDAKRIVAATVKRLMGYAPKVANTRQRDIDQTVEELVHPFAAKRNATTDWHPLSQFEIGDGCFGAGHNRFLASYRGQLFRGVIQGLNVANSLADAHVDHDFIQLGHLHDVFQLELALELVSYLFSEFLFNPIHCSAPSLIENGARSFRNPLLDAVFDLETDPAWPIIVGVDNHDIGDMQRRLEVDDAALGVLRGLPMLFNHVEPFDNDFILFGKDFEHLAAFSSIFPGHDINFIAFLNLCRHF